MRDQCTMSQNNAKGKNKKSKDNNESMNIGDKLNKKFRLSFRGNKTKKDNKNNKMTKGDDDEECTGDNTIRDYNDKLEDYLYLYNNNSNNLDQKTDCQRERTCDNDEIKRKNQQNQSDSDGTSVLSESFSVVKDILDEIFSAVAVNNSENSATTNRPINMRTELRKNTNPEERKMKASHRRTSIADENLLNLNYNVNREPCRRDSLYSVEEYDEDLDENENYNLKTPIQAINQVLVNKVGSNLTNEKHKKKSFLNLFFGKNKKEKKTEQTPKSKSLLGSRKYSSTFELSGKILEKSPSFIRKSIKQVVSKDMPSLLKRSFSVRDAEKKKEKTITREKLTVMKNLEWARSLQSLVENDNSVSYDDMSFINYDTLNTATYDRPRPSLNLHRTQSLIVHGSPGSFKAGFRGSSVPTHYQSAIDISEQSEALSLPSLQHAIRENEENVYDSSPPIRYRRRPQSISSEDGKARSRVNGSFRSAGSGCAKLKRTNACRQKSRDSLPLYLEERDSQTVRSRSLNHLDTLDMRYGVPCATDTTLKDSRSEPDCTRPLLAPPAPNVEPPSPTLEAPVSKRHVLSRSQKSSSECFSVNFEVGDESTWENELFYPAIRGVTLFDALANQSELRSIDLNNCDAWLQDKESNTNSLLSFSQDTANLVGRHIRITAKDYSNKRSTLNHSKKFAGGYKPKASGFFSSSTEENSASTNWTQDSLRLSFQDADSIKKQSKQRWSGFFSNNKDTKMEQLTELLNNYTVHGVPSSQIYPQGQVESLDALYKLEGDWREIINFRELPERLQQQQTALWELIKTEVAYIKTLKVVTDLFLACLKNLQSEGLLKEIDTEKLFSNITEILDTNVLFWRNSLFPLVRDMRKYKQPPCIETMLQGFLNMKDSFRAYFRYCAEQARCQHYCRENNSHNESFAAYLAWCETQKECNRLRLMDILVQPMQRLTKYGLLLKAILKNTDEEVERDSLDVMIKSVDDFVNNVNSSLKQRQDTERLKGLIVRIESYDVVESKDDDLEKLLKTYSTLDLNRPMINCPPERKRHLLLEGDLKLKDSNTSKIEVHCFLLTDILLVCKPSTKKGVATMRVIRQPYLVDRLDVTDLNKETPTLALIYKNEFNMPVAAFILQNNDARKLKTWKDSISKAQSLYAQAKQPTYLEESLDVDYGFGDALESDFPSLQLVPRSPLATSSRASRVSSLAHSHSGSVEMNDQSSIGSGKDHSRAVSVENENRTASISSDEGVQPLPPDKSPITQKNSFKHRLFNKTPNTLSVQPYTNLGQSLPNLALGSPNVGTLSLNLNQNTLYVPNTSKNSGQLLSPTHRGISYPPPSPTRANLRRGLAISQSKNPPLLKTRHVNSSSAGVSGQIPTSFDFDVPVIAGVSPTEQYENFSRGQLRQAMVKRGHRNETKRYHTAGVVDDIKRNDNRDANIHKRLSLNYSSQDSTPTLSHPQEDQT